MMTRIILGISTLLALFAIGLATPVSEDSPIGALKYHQTFKEVFPKNKTTEELANISGKLFLQRSNQNRRLTIGLRDFNLQPTGPNKNADQQPLTLTFNNTDIYLNYNEQGVPTDLQLTPKAQWSFPLFSLIVSYFQIPQKLRQLNFKEPQSFDTSVQWGNGNCTVHYTTLPTEGGFKIHEVLRNDDCVWDLTKIDSDEVDSPPKINVDTTSIFSGDKFTSEAFQSSESTIQYTDDILNYEIHQKFANLEGADAEFDGFVFKDKILSNKFELNNDIAGDYVTTLIVALNADDFISGAEKALFEVFKEMKEFLDTIENEK